MGAAGLYEARGARRLDLGSSVDLRLELAGWGRLGHGHDEWGQEGERGKKLLVSAVYGLPCHVSHSAGSPAKSKMIDEDGFQISRIRSARFGIWSST